MAVAEGLLPSRAAICAMGCVWARFFRIEISCAVQRRKSGLGTPVPPNAPPRKGSVSVALPRFKAWVERNRGLPT
jgi:hypothetical protein